MSGNEMFPPALFTLWHVTVIFAAIVLVPTAVYWLHMLWRTAWSIRRYAREALVATRGIEANTAAVPAIDGTIAVATEILTAAEAVAGKLDTIATVLEARTRRA